MVIYISKSKVGNHDDLMLLRQMLSTYDCEVTEHIGGTYSDKKLLEADVLFILPHTLKNDNIPVGKGQYDETKKFDNQYPDNTFIVTTIDHKHKEILFHEVINYNVYDVNGWTHHHGTLETDSGVWDFHEIMEQLEIEQKALPPITGCKPILGAIKHLKS